MKLLTWLLSRSAVKLAPSGEPIVSRGLSLYLGRV